MKKHPLHMLGRLVAGKIRNGSFIGMGSYYIITFIYVTTSKQYERTESKNLPETAMSQQAEALMKKSFRIMQGIRC